MADSTSSTNRRALLAGTPALLIASGARGDASDIDAGLIALCREHLALEEEEDRQEAALSAAEAAGDKATEDAIFQAIAARVPALHARLDAIADTPARTAEGMRLKARVYLTRVQCWSDGTFMNEDALAASVVHDLLGLLGDAA